ncbi:MAG: nucleotidyltransferase domain-containing protein [Candidatus Bathyarchaeia archaeon]
MAGKPLKHKDTIEVIYDKKHWDLLNELRKKALFIMQALNKYGIESYIHGSVARGDVNSKSDVDIIIPYTLSSNKIELALMISNIEIYSRKIVQATPSHSPKGHIYLNADESICVTFPLFSFKKLEFEFYKFGGLLGVKELKAGLRTPGCTKRLTLIEPIPKGHYETLIIGKEVEVAKKLGISIDIVKERIRVLLRRDEIGRTGIFLSIELHKNEGFEKVLKKLIESNPAVRRTYFEREFN